MLCLKYLIQVCIFPITPNFMWLSFWKVRELIPLSFHSLTFLSFLTNLYVHKAPLY